MSGDKKEEPMKKMLAVSFVLITLAAPLLLAQEARTAAAAPQDVRSVDAIVAPVACPRPVTLVINGASGAPQPLNTDLGPTLYPGTVGSQWNQTAADKHFGHTFRFAAPLPGRDCCLMTWGVLTVRVKALQGGGPKSSTSANDSFNLVSNGIVIQQQQPWNNGGVSTGAIATLTFNVPANVLATGNVSFYAQDDSAVLTADLSLRGCCLR
jgi:hypothetical protein